jgi:signal transduction histidine kinase
VDVVDDGVGIGTSPPGVGLSSMRERAAELGGSCVIGDAPGGGTSVRLDLPLEPVHRAVHTVGQP